MCVCVCARSLAHLVYIGSGYPFVLWGSCFWCVCMQSSSFLLCPFYNLVGVILLSFVVCGLVFLVVIH